MTSRSEVRYAPIKNSDSNEARAGHHKSHDDGYFVARRGVGGLVCRLKEVAVSPIGVVGCQTSR